MAASEQPVSIDTGTGYEPAEADADPAFVIPSQGYTATSCGPATTWVDEKRSSVWVE